MNVLFVSNDSSIFDPSSAARARMRAYAKALGELHIVSAGPRSSREESDGGLHLHPVTSSRPLRLPALFFAARRLVRAGRVEVVSAQDPFEHGLAALFAARGTHARLHIQLHTDPFSPAFVRAADVGLTMSYVNRVRLMLAPVSLRYAAGIRVVSLWLKRELERRYRLRAPIHVLPVFAELARFRAIARNPEKGRMLWIGRFEREKDPMLALETLAAARAVGIDAHLAMLGEGRLRQAVEARAKARGLSPYLELPGRADPAPYLARAELALATSRYEGYGLATLEALAAGCPVLSTDVGVAREAGAIIAPRDTFIQRAVELLKEGPPAPPPVPDPYPSFAAYAAAYVADLKAATAARQERFLSTQLRA